MVAVLIAMAQGMVGFALLLDGAAWLFRKRLGLPAPAAGETGMADLLIGALTLASLAGAGLAALLALPHHVRLARQARRSAMRKADLLRARLAT
jgi:hypothetical protein